MCFISANTVHNFHINYIWCIYFFAGVILVLNLCIENYVEGSGNYLF
jgi:hypothetical protein